MRQQVSGFFVLVTYFTISTSAQAGILDKLRSLFSTAPNSITESVPSEESSTSASEDLVADLAEASLSPADLGRLLEYRAVQDDPEARRTLLGPPAALTDKTSLVHLITSLEYYWYSANVYYAAIDKHDLPDETPVLTRRLQQAQDSIAEDVDAHMIITFLDEIIASVLSGDLDPNEAEPTAEHGDNPNNAPSSARFAQSANSDCQDSVLDLN